MEGLGICGDLWGVYDALIFGIGGEIPTTFVQTGSDVVIWRFIVRRC
jgi:hypothetical protein